MKLKTSYSQSECNLLSPMQASLCNIFSYGWNPQTLSCPSAPLFGTPREGMYLSTHMKIQQWCGGLFMVGALGEQFPTQNGKLTKFSTRTDSCLVRPMVKEMHSMGVVLLFFHDWCNLCYLSNVGLL